MKKICTILAALVPLFVGAQDDTGNAIKATTILHDDGSKTSTVLNPEKHTSEATTYNAADKVTQRIVYQLDEQNQPATGTMFAANGTALLKIVYKHDASNRITEEIDYTPDGKLLRRFTYDFGSNGKVSRIHAFDADGNEMQQSAARPDAKKAPPRRHR